MEKNGVTCIQFAASFFQEKKKKEEERKFQRSVCLSQLIQPRIRHFPESRHAIFLFLNWRKRRRRKKEGTGSELLARKVNPEVNFTNSDLNRVDRKRGQKKSEEESLSKCFRIYDSFKTILHRINGNTKYHRARNRRGEQ